MDQPRDCSVRPEPLELDDGITVQSLAADRPDMRALPNTAVLPARQTRREDHLNLAVPGSSVKWAFRLIPRCRLVWQHELLELATAGDAFFLTITTVGWGGWSADGSGTKVAIEYICR